MGGPQVRSLRRALGFTLPQFASLLRLSSQRTVQRWESGETPVSGPALIVLEMLQRGELPVRYFSAHEKGERAVPTPLSDDR